MQRFPNAHLDRLGALGVLGPDAPVDIGGYRRTVAGWITYDDEWVEYLLSDGSWLCVEDVDGRLAVSRWWDQPDAIVPAAGGQIVINGRTYRRTEEYRARWLAAGIEGLAGPGQVRVADYEEMTDGSPGLAAIEDWGEGGELSLGHRLDPSTVTLPPLP
jgi:hypothetical protein